MKRQTLGDRKHLDSEGDTTTSTSTSVSSDSSANTSPGSTGEYETTLGFARRCLVDAKKRLFVPRLFGQKSQDELHFIESFPTQRAQRYARISGNPGTTLKTCLDWRDFKSMGDIAASERIRRALDTKNILKQISHSLDIPGTGEPSPSPQVHPYFLENLGFAKEREVEYAGLFLRKNLSKEEIQWRDAQIKWIIKASQEFRMEVETTLIASYYMDAFLHRKRVHSQEDMEALAYAAFFAASKLEEVDAVALKDLLAKFFSLLKFHKKSILAKEVEMLSVLKFHSYPPTAKYMLDAALNRNSIEFPPGTKTHIEDRALSLLLMSLKEASFSRIKSSVKALTALEVASEFVIYHWDESSTYSQDYRVRERPVIPKAVISGCNEVFCDLLRQKVFEL